MLSSLDWVRTGMFNLITSSIHKFLDIGNYSLHGAGEMKKGVYWMRCKNDVSLESHFAILMSIEEILVKGLTQNAGGMKLSTKREMLK